MGDDRDSRDESAPDLLEAFREDASDTASLFGDMYRGEIDRTTAWRTRLDQTTNWAVVFAAAILTWAFSSPDNPHYVLLIGMLAIGAFLFIEAHRFREYDVWRSRVRLVQRNVFVGLLGGEPSDSGWQPELSESLDAPSFHVSFLRSVGHRLRRAYLPLLTVLLVSWVARVTMFASGESWRRTAAVPGVSGEVIALSVAVVYAALAAVAAWSAVGTATVEFRK